MVTPWVIVSWPGPCHLTIYRKHIEPFKMNKFDGNIGRIETVKTQYYKKKVKKVRRSCASEGKERGNTLPQLQEGETQCTKKNR